jgi:hypothetical protein
LRAICRASVLAPSSVRACGLVDVPLERRRARRRDERAERAAHEATDAERADDVLGQLRERGEVEPDSGIMSERSSGIIALNVLSSDAATAAPAIRRAPSSLGVSGPAPSPLIALNSPATIAWPAAAPPPLRQAPRNVLSLTSAPNSPPTNRRDERRDDRQERGLDFVQELRRP